ncbi:unnamed protein product [Adineta steineri]|uniref:G-protein coupled receptors family 1 profile domain-containing protein n=1 Tax=Adineta steineri TaxID=433720 RepID=A0A815AMP9_9BILA|nr:unnamed protein product [Adineta steineri]CAF3848012.1 unnamed protein product [Adineta steineri]
MLSPSTIDSINFLAKQINIYFGLFILILGIIGGLINIIIFTTLKTFRKTSCAFYLSMASIFNVGELISGAFTTILNIGFDIDPTELSYLCKIRMFLVQWFGLLSVTSMCLASIDQFLLVKYQYLTSLKLAISFITIACLIWSIHGIFFVLFWNSIDGVCSITNITFDMYITYFHFPILLGFLPLTIMILCSFPAFINARKLASRQINIIRLSCDRQLTAMTLSQIAFIVITTIPFITTYIFLLNMKSTDKEYNARMYLVHTITTYVYYTTYANSFYIYCFVSKRFRKQFIYVLINVHLQRYNQQRNRLNNNQVQPTKVGTSIEQIPKKNDEIALY